MGRAKKKRVNAMRCKQSRRVDRLLRAEAEHWVPPLLSPAQMKLNKYAYDMAQSFMSGAPTPMPPVLDVFFAALEASGMRRAVCSKCGREWLTRGADDTCPPCRDFARTAN